MSTDSNVARRGRPDFVPGVYTYCDGWCERCRFQQRCRVYRDMRRMEAALQNGGDASSLQDDEQDAEPAGDPPAEFLALLDAANREPSDAERREIDAQIERGRRRKDSHPLSVSSREYADVTHSLMEALRPMAAGRGDPIVDAAIETIDRFSYLIAVKTWRAVGGLPHSVDDDDDDEAEAEIDPVQTDANGCAKLVRSIVAESRDAWEVLMQLGTAATDDLPAQMVRRLEALDEAIAAAFPRAMEFVRPAFDEPD